MDLIPAIPEKAAVHEVAEIYADIKETLNVDVVNLIWRHLATIQSALPWVWSALKPIYKSGAAEAAAADLAHNLQLPNIATLPSSILRVVGVSEADKSIVCGILDTYNRSNTLNLVALSALMGQPSLEAVTIPKRKIPKIQVPIPALPDLDAMEPDVLNLVLEISKLGANPKDRIIPSMYRHLSFWPGFLAVAWSLISPLDSNGRIKLLIEEALIGLKSRPCL